MERKYGIGLDIGIGSCGWCIISWQLPDKSDARIEDLGVRLFDSGEITYEATAQKNRKNQERRNYRSVRRLLRRRKHRKERVKRFLQKIGLINCYELQRWQELNGNQNIFAVRFKGLSEKLTPEEIADCIIHICNHRGYRDFYDDEQDDDEAQITKQRLLNFETIYREGKYVSVADMILHDDAFTTGTDFPDYHNHKLKTGEDSSKSERYILIARNNVKKELLDILNKQQEFYPKELTEKNIDFIVNEIVFAQRDFETGPGKEGDSTRRFMSFLDSLGNCRFYKDERRAFRSTIIADIYALINSLSQFTYVDIKTGEVILKPEASKAIINMALENGGVTEADIKKILKHYDLEWVKPSSLSEKIPDTVKTLKTLKRILEQNGYSYQELIKEEQFDLEYPSRLHALCICLSENITPARRKKALSKLGWSEKLQDALVRQKFGGTASVCEQYMLDAIKAFCDGEAYGNFQARILKNIELQNANVTKHVLLPVITKVFDEDITKNVVVFKSINEVRKVINALVRKYGSPEYINVEVADELGKSFMQRKKIEKENKNNRKNTEEIASKLVELGLRKEGEVKSGDILKYRLWLSQGGIDLYTGEIIDISQILSYQYEVDHIVPFSLILDDTIHNKALVNLGANRAQKAQQVPLEYLQGMQRDTFLKNVNLLFKKKKISQKKYQYLMMESLGGKKAQEILAEWKSRNINDTRYITRYIVNYLTNNLQFNGNQDKKHVFGVKGALTSRLRKIWLKGTAWGSDEKSRENNLHHAADAVVIANMTPACIELASDNIKLNSIFYSNRKRRNTEYDVYLEKAKRKMEKYYGYAPEYTEMLLTKHGRVPSIIRRITEETFIRLTDPTVDGYVNVTQENFECNVKAFYADNPEFAGGITMPLVSYKQEKKYQGKMTKDGAVRKQEADDKLLLKEDAKGNITALPANLYYCIEVYKDVQGATQLRGVRFVDLVKRDKKLWLRCAYPEDYKSHVMYLFANDYIRVFNSKGVVKFEGYYKSVKNIFRNCIYLKINNSDSATVFSITKKDTVKKFAVDVLGKIGGEVQCSAPFMLLPENV